MQNKITVKKTVSFFILVGLALGLSGDAHGLTVIPTRTRGNTPTITLAIFNTIKQAVDELQAIVGAGAIGETTFTIANNTGSPTNITGMLFASASYRSAVVDYDITRKTDTGSSEVREVGGRIILAYRVESSAWSIEAIQAAGDDSGVDFTVTSAGQVQYVSTNIAGANYVGTISFRALTFDD